MLSGGIEDDISIFGVPREFVGLIEDSTIDSVGDVGVLERFSVGKFVEMDTISGLV